MAAAASARTRLDLDAMLGGGRPSAVAAAVPPPLGAPPQRRGKGGRRPKKARPGRVEPGEPHSPTVGPLWKTRLCAFHAAGGCHSSSRCPFAHGAADLRPSPDFERTSVCPSLLSRGRCDRIGCRYAHHAEELRVQEGLLKTKMCAFYQNDQCIVGDACRFAHSEREIQEALALQRAAAQRSLQPPPPAAELAAQGRSGWQLRRSAFVCPPGAEAAVAPASAASRGEARPALERRGRRAALEAPREPSPPAPSAAVGSGPVAFSLTAPPGLLEFPARVSDNRVVIDARGDLAEIEDMVLDVEAEVIASSVLLASGLPQKVPLPAPHSSQLLARVVTLEEDLAELAPREPAAPPRPREEAPRCAACGGALAPGQRFCSACGARAPAAAGPAPAAAAEGGGVPPPPAAAAAAPPSPRSASAARRRQVVKRIRKEALVPKPATVPSGAVDDAAVVLDIEDDSLVAELTKARLELGQPGPPAAVPGAVASLRATPCSASPLRQGDGAGPAPGPTPPRGVPLQGRRRLTVGIGADLAELGLDGGAGGGGLARAAAPQAAPGCRTAGRFAGCALCPRANGHHAAGGAPCAACTCGLKVVHQNTFLTVQDDEAQEEQHGAARRSLSV